MQKVSGLLTALLLLVPTMATAGTIYLSTPTTSPARGTISPKGYVFAANTGNTTFSVIPAAGYAIGTVTLDGVPLAATGLVAGGKSYSVANKAATQKVVAGFVYATTPGLAAKLSTPLTVAPGSPLLINGSASTISLPPTALNASYTWSVSPAGPVLSRTSGTTESSAGLSTTFTSASAGVYTVTLSLSAPGLTPSSASTSVVIQTPAILQSKACSDCHAGAQYLDYAGSLHANNPYEAVTCQLCHNPGLDLSHPGLAKGTEALGNVCVACHEPYNVQVTNYLKSSHYTSTHMKVYCASCHNPHSTVATYGAGTAGGCQSCHAPGSPYGIYNADLTGKAPHYQTGTPDASGFYATGSYIMKTAAPFTAGGKTFSTQATCADCHGHDNTINAGWAEAGHGSVTAVPWKSDSGHIWLNQGPAASGVNFQTSPQQTNCIRCHSAQGFIQFVESGFTKIDRIKNAGADIKDSSPLTCNGCHTSPEGGLRLANFTTASHGAKGYKAFWGYSNPLIAGKKVVTAIQLGDNRNSNICMPCHSQRASGQEIKDVFATGSFKQYSAGTAIYPHEAQPAAVFYGKGGYEFTSSTNPASGAGDFDYQDRARHQRIGNYLPNGYNGTGVTAGSCAGCHMTSPKTHSLEALTKDASGNFTQIVSNECVKCHPGNFTYQDIQTTKASYDALVKALGNALVAKGLTQDGINPLAERKAFDMSLGKKDNAIAQVNMGAWFNWYIFKTADPAAYAHNPSYARRLLSDSIDMLDDGVINNSVSATLFAQQAAGKLSQVELASAFGRLTEPGCMGCHFGTGPNVANGEPIPGVQKAPHYNYDGALVPGQTFTQAQFVVPNAQCNNCHGYGHGTDSPGGTILKDYAESQHGSINGLAWTDYDFKTRQGCVQCHTTTGFVKNVGVTFAAGVAAPSINAWGSAGDPTKQVLGCNACHSSTAWKTSVRNGGAVIAPMGVAGNTPKAVMNFLDVGESNVCILCHASRENGESLIASNNASFTNPHYLAAAAVFYGNGGFWYYSSSVRYNKYGAAGKVGRTANWSHGRLGMDNYTAAAASASNAGVIRGTGNKGQCIACHLGPKNTHTFGAAEVANATKGTNTTLTRTCYGCHANSDPNNAVPTIEAFIDEEKENWYRMFDFFKWQLAQYGINYTDSYPYFSFNTGVTFANALVGTTFGGPGVQDANRTEGACMNLKLLLAEKGSHVHNRAFGRALIADSIIYLQKGNDMGSYSTVYPKREDVIKFSDYSAARPTSYPGQVGPDVSITTLKSYLTRASGGGFIRR